MPRNKTTHELAKELLSKPDIPVEVSVNAGKYPNLRIYCDIFIDIVVESDIAIICVDGVSNNDFSEI